MSAFQFPQKKTRIVATIGPASRSPALLEKLILAGMNIARINFAHGDLAGHGQVIRDLRMIAGKLGRRVAIMGDLPGPKMRIGKLQTEPIQLERNQSFTLRIGDGIGDQSGAFMDFAGLAKAVQPGDNIFLNDGYVQLRVDRVNADAVHTSVIVGGELRSHKGVNFPGIDLGISAFTERDGELLQFAAEQQLDAVSQSFVATADDLAEVRAAAQRLGYTPMVIAKIERAGALEHIDAILEAADGIMVARGDLGVEIPIEEVAAVQKDIILRAQLAAKPVITATQMLESMVHYRRPTRAEVSDVTNAILDGSDAVMLSGETAVGDYPDEAVAMMARIAVVAENMPTGDRLIEVLNQAVHAKDGFTGRSCVAEHVSDLQKPWRPISFLRSAPAAARRVVWPAIDCLPGSWPSVPPKSSANNSSLCAVSTRCMWPKWPASWATFVRQWVLEKQLDAGLAILTEGGGTLRTSGATRLEMIDLHHA